MVPVIVRIGLRYVAAALVAKGIFTSADAGQFSTDPDVANLLEVGIGLAIGAATEAWYAIAKRLGWRT
jgi:hypothetical protein